MELSNFLTSKLHSAPSGSDSCLLRREASNSFNNFNVILSFCGCCVVHESIVDHISHCFASHFSRPFFTMFTFNTFLDIFDLFRQMIGLYIAYY